MRANVLNCHENNANANNINGHKKIGFILYKYLFFIILILSWNLAQTYSWQVSFKVDTKQLSQQPTTIKLIVWKRLFTSMFISTTSCKLKNTERICRRACLSCVRGWLDVREVCVCFLMFYSVCMWVYVCVWVERDSVCVCVCVCVWEEKGYWLPPWLCVLVYMCDSRLACSLLCGRV